MDNFKKEIWAVFGLVAFLGVFFQLNRMDTLLRMNAYSNSHAGGSIYMEDKSQQLPRESFLLIYDPLDVQSVLTRHMVEKIFQEQKKSVAVMPIYQQMAVDQDCRGVVIATNKLKSVSALPAVMAYVEQGGSAAVLRNLQKDLLPDEMMERLGIASLGSEISAHGIRVPGTMFLGLQGFGFDSAIYSTPMADVQLLSDAVPQVTSQDDKPIIWSHASGRGRYLVCNSRERDDKNNYGTYTALLSMLDEDYVYPVMNLKLFFIDDFPSPVPEGNFDRIYRETGLSTADFYRRLWWPEMLDNGEKYNIKYTGLIIESYGNQVKGPFYPLASGESRSNMIVYGRELLKAGGELGIHGYNHQSLAPAGYARAELGYIPWESQQDMEESLQELKRYVEDAYPGYEIHTYVPPSNILSPQGKEAVKNVFPQLKVYASLWNGPAHAEEYFQDFKVNADGTCEIPRVSSGYAPPPESIWEEYNVVNYNGVFSHFVHPDEIFYEQSSNLTWNVMKCSMQNLLSDLDSRFGWLQPATATEAAARMEDFFAMDYRVERSSKGLKLHAWGFCEPLTFILRSHKDIGDVRGGTARKIQADAYVLTVEKPEFEIRWAGADL